MDPQLLFVLVLILLSILDGVRRAKARKSGGDLAGADPQHEYGGLEPDGLPDPAEGRTLPGAGPSSEGPTARSRAPTPSAYDGLPEAMRRELEVLIGGERSHPPPPRAPQPEPEDPFASVSVEEPGELPSAPRSVGWDGPIRSRDPRPLPPEHPEAPRPPRGRDVHSAFPAGRRKTETQREPVGEAGSHTGAPPTAGELGFGSITALRRAIVAREVLGPPLALRAEGGLEQTRRSHETAGHPG